MSSSLSCVPVSNYIFLIYKVSLYIRLSFILRFIQFKCWFYCDVGLEEPTVFYNWISFPLHKPVAHWQHCWAIVYSSKGCICFVIANILKLQPWVWWLHLADIHYCLERDSAGRIKARHGSSPMLKMQEHLPQHALSCSGENSVWICYLSKSSKSGLK